VCWSCRGNDVCEQIHEQYQSQNWRVTAQSSKFMSNINHELKSHCTSSYLSSVPTASCLSLSPSRFIKYSHQHKDCQTGRDRICAVVYEQFQSQAEEPLCTIWHPLCMLRLVKWSCTTKYHSYPTLYAEPSQRWIGDMKGQGRMIITTTVNSSHIPLVGVPLKNINRVTLERLRCRTTCTKPSKRIFEPHIFIVANCVENDRI
jgi:hypothetical protein